MKNELKNDVNKVRKNLKKVEADVDSRIEDRLRTFQQKLAQTGTVEMSSEPATNVMTLRMKSPTYDGITPCFYILQYNDLDVLKSIVLLF